MKRDLCIDNNLVDSRKKKEKETDRSTQTDLPFSTTSFIYLFFVVWFSSPLASVSLTGELFFVFVFLFFLVRCQVEISPVRVVVVVVGRLKEDKKLWVVLGGCPTIVCRPKDEFSLTKHNGGSIVAFYLFTPLLVHDYLTIPFTPDVRTRDEKTFCAKGGGVLVVWREAQKSDQTKKKFQK